MENQSDALNAISNGENEAHIKEKKLNEEKTNTDSELVHDSTNREQMEKLPTTGAENLDSFPKIEPSDNSDTADDEPVSNEPVTVSMPVPLTNGTHDIKENTLESLKHSNSAEFTYTSLGEMKVNADDEILQQEQAKLQQPAVSYREPPQHQASFGEENVQINNTDQKASVLTSLTDIEAQQHESLKKQDSLAFNSDKEEDSLLKLPFDSIIEKVKQNRLSHKEVSNYVLNLLVGGEFDLEKNFVIQNLKNILLMIQVIKCATPSLKVRFRTSTVFYF
jgi:hypothetical protein